MNADLIGLGDELELAISTRIAHGVALRRTRRHRSRGTIVAGMIGAVVVAGAGSAAAYSLLAPEDVSRGLPAANLWLAGTTPVCTDGGPDTFRCTIRGGVGDSSVTDWTGTVEPFVDAHKIVLGGCRSDDATGTLWICYSGQKAVDEEIIGQQLLGQLAGPSAG